MTSTPYPYVVSENLLAPDLLRDLRRNWPGVGSFIGEVPGNFTCNVVQFVYESHGFWGKFTYEIVPSLVVNYLTKFSGHLEKRFPQERNYYLSNYSFMQSLGTYGGHDVHTHHYHDPQWAMTILVYLDPESNGHEGTTIMGVKEGLDESEVAAQTLNWHDLTEDLETVDYKQGRILAFFENPISFHRVKPSIKALFGRRILRFHVAVDTGHVERIYGVDLETYQDKRKNPTKDPQVLEWMKKDLEIMRNPISMSEEEKKKWCSEIRLGIPKREAMEGEPN